VCLSAIIAPELLDQSAPNFVCRSPVVVARSSSGGVAQRYVPPVLWMTSRSVVMFGRNGRDAKIWRLTHVATAMNDVAIPGAV